MTQLIYGAKAGSQQPKQPTIAKDTVASISRLKILYALTEGEARGLVAGGASILMEGTPLLDSDGNKNFEDVEWEVRTGTVDQTHIAGMPSVSNEIAVGTVVRSGTPWIRTINNTQISSVNVNVSWPRLSETTSDFDVIGTEVNYKIEVRTDGGSYETVLVGKVKDKTSGRYQRTHNIKLPEAVSGWQIRVTKLTEDGDGERKFNAMQVDSIAEIIDAKLRYPHTALLYLSFDARTFSSIPKVAVDFYGRYLQVPSNYDADARTSTGLWDGTFKQAYTDNPAWAYYDLITNDRYGLGDKLKPFMINKWAIEYIARICDEMVDDGNGGTEPRFACNLYLQKAEDAYRVLQHLAGIFRGMSFWNGSQIVLDADTYRDADYVITAANVVDGEFVKTGTALADRHTVAKVAYSNPNNNYETDYVMVRNESAIAQRGINMLDMAAVGCTSEGQAYRMGLAALLTEQNRTQTVSFAMGLDGTLPEVGSRVDIADPMFTGYNNGGRISAVSANRKIITVDRDEVPATTGYQLTVNLESGKAQTRNIVSVDGRKITVSEAFDPVAAENAWAISTDEMPTMPFIVLAVTGNDDGTQYNYTALQYDSTLYKQIDDGTLIEPRPPMPSYNPFIILEPEAVTVSSRHRVVQGMAVTTLVITWSQVEGAVAYEVEWRKDDGEWVKLPPTGNISTEVDGVYSGNYLARVRAVSAFDAVSKPATSILTAIVGKAGTPPTLTRLTATGVLFGMDLTWAFAQGSGDTAYTEIQVASAPDVNVALLGQYAYPTDNAKITGLQGNLTQHYRARIIDKLGFKSDWTEWVSGTTDASADKILDLLEGQITESQLYKELTTKIDKVERIEPLELLVGDETKGLVKAIADERDARISAIGESALGGQKSLHERADALADSVNEITEVQDKVVTDVEQSLTKLTFMSSQLDFGYADATQYASANRSTAWTFAKTVAREDYINAEMARGLSAKLDDAEASFTEQITATATKSEAVTKQITTLSAQITGGYTGNDLGALSSGLIHQEREARASDFEALAEQVSLVSAGVGEQFDPFSIWHFSEDADGWTGGTYELGYIVSRTAKLQSPALVMTNADGDEVRLSGNAYHHLRMRVEKVGEPTWSGLVEWFGGSITIAAPEFDEHGVASVGGDLEWSGDINDFSIKLADAADDDNYYKLDWIAVGRPSPGASSSSVLDIKRAFANYKMSSAQAILDLSTDIHGTDVTPLSASIREQLTVIRTDTAAVSDKVDVLDAWYEGKDADISAIVREETAGIVTDTSANARKLEELSAEIDFNYADETQYVNKNRSMQWTFATAIANADWNQNQRITYLQSEFADSSAQMQNELITLASKDMSLASEQTRLSAKVGDNSADILSLQLAISTPESGLAAQVDHLQSITEAATILAGSKGEIIYSAGAPPVGKQLPQNLWFKKIDGKTIPHSWDGDAWVELTNKAAADARADAAQAQDAADAAQSAADAASSAASTAQSAAEAAQSTATAATNQLTDISSDSRLTAVEKQQVKLIWDEVKQVDTSIRARANKYGASITSYNAAYIALNSYITPLLTDMSSTSTIDRATFDSRFNVLFTNRAALDTAIVNAAKAATDAAQSKADSAKSAADVAQGAADAAQADADAAQGAADAAQSTANTAKSNISDISADNKLTPVEKKQTKVIWLDIQQVDADIRARAAKYSVSITAYNTAYAALNTYITPLLADTSTTSNIARSTFDSRFNTLFAKRAELDTAIISAAKTLTDEAKSAATQAKDAADAAQSTANSANSTAKDKGEVIYSSTTPAAAKRLTQNLWIDTKNGKNTPKRWNGSTWVAVSDREAIDKAEDLKANLATYVQQSGAFSDEFDAISGQITTLQRTTKGQTESIEVIASLGDADKLKLEIAKARLDKDAAAMEGRYNDAVALITQYQTKRTELIAKRNAETDTALRKAYADQIALLDAAISDTNTHKNAMLAQLVQLLNEIEEIKSLKQTESDVKAQYFVKFDAGGRSAGFGLLQNKNATVDFAVLADKFYIAPSTGTSKGVKPFTVLTKATTINGVSVPAGTYIDGDLIATGAISGDKIRANTSITAPQINGGSININNKFIVDANGNLTGKSGTFEGTVLATKISGTIDVESMKRSAWTPSYSVFYSEEYGNIAPHQFASVRNYKSSHVSYGSIDVSYDTYKGEASVGSVMFEVQLNVKTQKTVTQRVLLVDDSLRIYVNGTLAATATNKAQVVSYVLPAGANLVQVILVNSGGGGSALTLAGDFIDNVNVKFA